jgi:PAS domain S-box-containing protein
LVELAGEGPLVDGSGQLSSALLRLALDNLADSVTIHDARGKLIYVNQATARLMGGQSVDEIIASPPGSWTKRFAMYREDGRPVELEELPGRRVFSGETPEPLLVRRVDREDGNSRWIRIKAAPLRDASGQVAAAVNVSEDVSDVKEAELAQQLLAEAGGALAASLDYEQTLQQVARLAVPALADWCGVELVSPSGDLEQVAIAHVDPGKVELGRELRERYPADPDAEGGTNGVLRTGQAQLVQEIPDELLVAAAQDQRHLELLRAIGMRSVLVLPLRFGHQSIGTMSFVLQDRRFSEADVALAEELARRAVVAIENSRLYTERARIATTLQQGLLPPTIEAPPGWETAVLFRAAGPANEVGGDFYDMVRLDHGWVGFVGDVTGKGATAAAITARARYTMISVAQLTGAAGRALEQLNLALVDFGGQPFCTVASVQILGDGDGGEGQVEVISAGHPLPYVIGQDGVVSAGKTGPLLGFDRDSTWSPTGVSVDPGEAIVLYSDGVTDTVGPGRERFGDKRLQQLLGEVAGDTAAQLIERLDRELLDYQDADQTDDIAVLVLRRRADSCAE